MRWRAFVFVGVPLCAPNRISLGSTRAVVEGALFGEYAAVDDAAVATMRCICNAAVPAAASAITTAATIAAVCCCPKSATPTATSPSPPLRLVLLQQHLLHH